MEKSSKRIGEILIDKGYITEAQLHDSLMEQKINAEFLGKILIGKGVISDRQLIEALSEQFNMPIVDLKTEYIDMELARKFSSSLIVDHKCFPLRQDEYTVTVAILNPLNVVPISKLEEEANPRKLELVLASEADLNDVIKQFREHISKSIRGLLKKNPFEGNK
jgi:type IV pilus assembly protein PilB